MKNQINAIASDLNLKVSAVTVATMNPVIFATKYLSGLSGSGIVKDGDKVYKIDTVKNTSVEVTSQSLSDAATAGLLALSDKNTSEIATAISFGLVKEITMTRADIATNGHSDDVSRFAKDLGLKVLDVTIVPQNDVIFQAQGIANLDGLTELEGKYYKLDTVANTASIINPDAVAADAKKDIMKGKTTDLVRFVQRYNLISDITFGIKADALSDKEQFILDNA